jgi:O-antigen/teichoic acid export membrane protein
VPQRPQEAPFAAVLGLLVAAEYGYLSWLLWDPAAGLDWFVVVPLVLAAVAVAGAVLVVLGRGRGWVVLTVVSVVLLLGLLVLVAIFGALGGGAPLWQALLLLIGPIGCLALTLRRPVREWTTPVRARRSSGGRRTAGPAR